MTSARVRSATEFGAWLSSARPGDSAVLFQGRPGDLARARAEDPVVAELWRAVADSYASGTATPGSRPLVGGVILYTAIRCATHRGPRPPLRWFDPRTRQAELSVPAGFRRDHRR